MRSARLASTAADYLTKLADQDPVALAALLDHAVVPNKAEDNPTEGAPVSVMDVINGIISEATGGKTLVISYDTVGGKPVINGFHLKRDRAKQPEKAATPG